jgi:hypothetical protein
MKSSEEPGSDEIFVAATRSLNDFAGVLECDEEVGYFYLYKLDTASGNSIVKSACVSIGKPQFSGVDVKVHWADDESCVRLEIKGEVMSELFIPYEH